MRDIALTLIFLGLIPVMLRYPWIGVLVYAWVSVFNPHKWTFGFAYDFPLAMLAAVVTAAGMLLRWKEVRLPINMITVLLMLLPFWMTVTLMFAFEPDAAYARWQEVMKIFLFALITAALLHSRKQLEALLWVLVVSIGFYGVKGGIFTFSVEGAYRVYGPPGTSYITDNNAIPVALIMTIPLMQYLAHTAASKWVKSGLYGAIFLSAVAVLGSQSRGAFVAIGAMLLFMWLKSRRKVLLGLALVIVVPALIGFMPDTWRSRMETIPTYEDQSAQGRLNTWAMAINLANDRPLVGGGFEPYTLRVFGKYAPDPLDVHSAHSIYFQMLGEHGYVGLVLFLCLGIASWMMARRILQASRDRPEYAWADNLARAMQVSFVGFAVGGAFINIAYWEVVYFEIVILMAACNLVREVAPKAPHERSERALQPAVT
jgi:putative inorganic carbon (HCO3(-)) transporter